METTQTRFKRTKDRVQLEGNARPSLVYVGPRGGMYVVKKGEYVSISKEFFKKHQVKPPVPKPALDRSLMRYYE